MTAIPGCEVKKMLQRSDGMHFRVACFEDLLSKVLIGNARPWSLSNHLFSRQRIPPPSAVALGRNYVAPDRRVRGSGRNSSSAMLTA